MSVWTSPLWPTRTPSRALLCPQVQVHPTGFVDPSDPRNPTKFLAPERLRGTGAVLFNREGRRFVDELSTRDRVTAAIMEQGPADAPGSQPGGAPEVWLVLPEAGREAYGAADIDFYQSRGLFAKVAGLGGLAWLIGAEEAVLVDEVEAYNRAAAGEAQDAFGKTVFPVTLGRDEAVWAARVTPVVHYCMGGVRVDREGRVRRAAGLGARRRW